MSHCVKLLGKSLQSCPSSKSNDATGDKACIWIAIMRNPETNYKPKKNISDYFFSIEKLQRFDFIDYLLLLWF